MRQIVGFSIIIFYTQIISHTLHTHFTLIYILASSESSRSSRKHAQSPASSKQNGHQDEERKHKICM